MQEILGQGRAIEVLERAYSAGRMHHAWIFHGPYGVGKATTAHALAKVLLCHQASTGEGGLEACGRCESCRLVQGEDSAHPDLHVITKELAGVSQFKHLRDKKQINIPIDLLRERMVGGDIGSGESKTYVEPIIGKSSILRHNRVFIIDEAELLSEESQHALLKTLEEPPPGVYIFLITTHEDRLLPTIRSRSQRLAFSPLEDAILSRWIAQRVGEGGEEVSPAGQRSIVRFAHGSIGRAQLALAYGLGNWGETVEPMLEKLASQRPPSQPGADLTELVDNFVEQWVKAHKNASKEAAKQAGVRHLFALMGEMCRIKLKETADGFTTAGANPERVERAIEPWLAGVELLQEAQRQLASHVSHALVLDNLMVQWTARASGARR